MAYHGACSGNGTKIACDGRRVNVFDVASREKISSSFPFSYAGHPAFSPNASLLALKSTTGRIGVVDSATGGTLFDHKNQKEGEGCGVYFSPDGTELIDGSWKGLVTVRKALGSTIVKREDYPGEMIARISHDDRRHNWLFEHVRKLNGSQKQRDSDYLVLRNWPFTEGHSKTFDFDTYIRNATLSPDGSLICAGCDDKAGQRSVQIFRVSDGAIVATTCEPEFNGTNDLTWSPDQQFIGLLQSKQFIFYRSSDLTVVARVPGRFLSSMCFLPNSNLVALGSWQTSILVAFDDVLAGRVEFPSPRV
jgi:WD40 repeat protein